MRRDRTLTSGLALAYTLGILGDNMIYVFLPSDPAAAGITAASLGLVLSANRIVRLAANSLGGLLSDRLDRRRPYLLGMALAALSTAGYIVADGLWPLVACRVLWGIAFSLISVGGVAIVLDLSRAEERGRVIGSYQSQVQLGTLVGFVSSGVLTDLFGYRGTLALYVPLAVAGLGIAAFTLRGGPAADRAGAAAPAASGLGTLAALRRLDPRLLAPAYASFASLFAGSGVVMGTLAISLKQLAAEPGQHLWLPVASLTGALLASRRLVAMIEAPIAGRWLDRLGDRRAVAIAGALLSLAGLSVLAAGRDAGLVVAGVLLTSMGEGLLTPAVVVWTGDGAPPHLRGVVMGGLATAGDLGAALGPLVAYALLETTGLRAAYALCAALMLSAVVLLAAVRSTAAARPRST